MMGSNGSKILLWVSLCFNLANHGLCFQANHDLLIGSMVNSRTCAFKLQSKLFEEEAFDGEFIGESSKSLEAGETLAKSFYDEMRKRSNGDEAAMVASPSKPNVESNNGPDNISRLMDDSTDIGKDQSSPKKKFTGRQLPAAQQFMSSSSRATTNGPEVRTPKEIMMEQEFQLVGRAEKGLAVQGAFAVLALAFYIYIGLSGGITNRSEESLQDFGGDDMLPFEQLVPIQKDREESVWL